MTSTLNILLLCDRPWNISANVHQHLAALVKHPRHKVWEVPVLGDIPEALDLDRFDAIVIHYTLVLCNETYVSAQTRARLREFKGLKAVFIQDEYRFINNTIAALKDIGADLLFTCVPEPEIEKVYAKSALPDLTAVNVLTGYVDESLFDFDPPPLATRPFDVGYRARKVPFWLGEKGREKWRIGQIFRRDAKRYNLKVDISYREEERLYGRAWTDFIMNTKALLGVESGSSVFDFSGRLQAAVDRDVRNNPSISYKEVRAKHFKDIEGEIDLSQMSPRCFEAAALKTLMVMYEGHYSGCMEAWRHYVPLKKDHGNMDEVVAVLRDIGRCQEIVDNAYNEVALNPANHFKTHAETVMEAIEKAWRAKMRPLAAGYDGDTFARHAKTGAQTRRNRRRRELFTWLYYLLFKRLLGFLPEARRETAHRHLSRYWHVLKRLLRRA